MKKLLIVTAVLMSALIVVSTFSGTATAGVDPNPFKSSIGKLGSIDNNLKEIHRNLGRVLEDPPLDDSRPSWKGPTNQLEAISHQLGVLDGRLEEILAAQHKGEDLLELFAWLAENLLFRLENEIGKEMLDFLSLHDNDMDRMPEVFVDSFYDVLNVIGGMEDRIFEFMSPTIPPVQ